MCPSKLETRCPDLYKRLPDPQTVLNPEDTELCYYYWMPGFKWTPVPVFEEIGGGEQIEGGAQQAEITDDDLREALEEMVEQDELLGKFNQSAEGGAIDCEKAAQLARQIGLAPSQLDVSNFENEMGGKGLKYNDFQQFCAKCTHPEDKVEDMISALSLFDTSGNGVLSTKQMNNIFSTYGEVLKEAEVSQILQAFAPGQTEINLKTFGSKIIAKEP